MDRERLKAKLRAEAKLRRDKRIEAAKSDYRRDISAIARILDLDAEQTGIRRVRKSKVASVATDKPVSEPTVQKHEPRLSRGQLRDAIADALPTFDKPFSAGRVLRAIREKRPTWNGELRRSSVAAALKKLRIQGKLRITRGPSGRRPALYEVVPAKEGG